MRHAFGARWAFAYEKSLEKSASRFRPGFRPGRLVPSFSLRTDVALSDSRSIYVPLCHVNGRVHPRRSRRVIPERRLSNISVKDNRSPRAQDAPPIFYSWPAAAKIIVTLKNHSSRACADRISPASDQPRTLRARRYLTSLQRTEAANY